jgi:hypothetical protein
MPKNYELKKSLEDLKKELVLKDKKICDLTELNRVLTLNIKEPEITKESEIVEENLIKIKKRSWWKYFNFYKK